jgi:hypothetical protein
VPKLVRAAAAALVDARVARQPESEAIALLNPAEAQVAQDLAAATMLHIEFYSTQWLADRAWSAVPDTFKPRVRTYLRTRKA